MSKINLGILGGGQLGSMLATAAKKLNVQTFIYCDDENAPAQKFADDFILGDYNDENKISDYLDDGWIILNEDSKEKICTWKSVPATKDCDMEKDKGCKITKPDKIGVEKIYLLEK